MSKSRVIIVTGASRGIGAAIAKRFAEPGAVVVLAQRHADAAEPVADVVRANGAESHLIESDVGRQDLAHALVEETLERYGQVDVLVNNAGTIIRQSVIDTVEDEWDGVFRTNVKGVLFTCQAVAPAMMAKKRGVIINVSSIAGTFANENRAAYCASKGAVNALTKVLALELAPFGIRVNAVAPGFISTELNEVELSRPGVRQMFEDRIPSGRVGSVAEVAGAVYLLASDDASYISGEVLVVDGLWTVRQNFPKGP